MLKRESPVARFVVMMLLIVALSLFAALGTLDYLSQNAALRGELRNSAQVTADQLAASLALPVWNFDQPQLDKIAESVLHDREAEGVVIRMNDVSSPGGLKIYGLMRAGSEPPRAIHAGEPEPVGTIFEERPILANGEQLGSVKVYYSPRLLQAGLWKHLNYQIAIFLAFVAILTASLYFLLSATVLRPLRAIERYAGEVSSGGAGRLPVGRFRGELQRLRASIEKMVDLLATRYASLKQNEVTLASQLRFEELVAGISAMLVAAQPDNLHAILARALAEIGRALDADRVVLGRTDDQTGEMIARAHYRRTEPPFPDRLVISERYPALWRTLRGGEISSIENVGRLGKEEAVDRAHFQEVGIQSQVTAPVLVEGRLQYILAVAGVGRTIHWSDEAVARIKILAEVLATTALRCEAEEVVRSYSGRIHNLATALTRAEERQRRELATILHDGVGQNLFAATAQLLALRHHATGESAELDKALALLDQVTRDTRELTFELCPPVLYQLGLMPALQRLAEQHAARHGVTCTVSGNTAGPADLNARGLAYQAVRELLNNAAKHAGAKRITIHVSESDGEVRIEVADAGAGFDPARVRPGNGGFGLFHLRERIELLGGSLAIDSTPGQGTRVQLRLPLNVLQPAE